MAFKHFYTLLMVFLQFTLDELGPSHSFDQLPADVFCQHINNFISLGVDRLTRLYKLEDLAIFK